MNGPKRSRLPPSQHQNHRQTRVVFVRGLPPECSESELLALCCPFAVVEKSFMIPQKAQAFIQLPDVLSATNLINFYQTREAVIRGKRVYFEFSSREEITSKGDKHPLDSIHGGGFHDHRQEIQQVGYPIPTSTPNPILNMNPNPIQQEPTYGRRGGPGVPSAILMVMVSKVEYDVTADILQQVFQKFGNVQRIITFWKNNECKALIQMESIEQAQAAQGALDGRDIYTGCNTLHIIFSRHTELKVRFNNERSRDFLDPTIPQGPPVGPGYLAGGPSGGGGSNGGPGFEEYDQEPPPYDVDPNGYGPPPPSSAPHYPPPGPAGPLGPPSYPPGPGPLPPYGDPRDDPYYSRNGPRDRRERSRSRDRIRTGAGMDYEARRARLPPHSTGRSMRSDAIRSPTLICSNMDSRLVTVDRVFTFFGCFGDVERIKIMFRKQDTALIQFVDEENAISALDHLDGVVVFGKKLRVDFSKHPNVSMPRGDVDRFELENTREFTNSPLHRYRRRSPSEAASIGPLLHVSGIPHDLQQNQNALIELFAQHGTVKTFHYLLKSANMAMVEMSSVDEAVMALLTLDNLTYPDSHMRVSFSKAYIPPPVHGGGFHSGGWNGRSDSPPRRDSNRERSRSRERHGGFNGGRGNHRVLPSGRY